MGFALRDHGRRGGRPKTTDSLVIGACRPAYRPSACPHHPFRPDLRRHVLRLVPLRARPAGRHHRPADDQERSRCGPGRRGVDGQRLHARVRPPPDRRGRPRRPLRAQADVRRRHRDLHRGLGRRRVGHRRRRARGRTGGAGCRRGDLRSARDDPAHRGDAGRTPREGARCLGRDRRSRRGAGTPARRRPHRARRLAVDLLDQRASRAGAGGARRAVPRREPGAAGPGSTCRRCACSGAGPSPPPMPSRCCSTPRCSGGCSSSPS